MDLRLTPEAEAEIELGFKLKHEAVELLELIVAEFNSDPMSVQCFDLRTVARAKETVRQINLLRKRRPFSV